MTKKYEKDNPLGNLANMFDAIASRIRDGQEYESVLFDYGLCTEKEADERVVMAMDVSKIELAEVKQENLKLSALVVERDYQITLANKGYDYEGAVEDSRHYKEMAEKYKAELAAYKSWAEVEIADLREDLSDHIRMAISNRKERH